MNTLYCCNACLPITYVGHMGLAENIQVRERMIVEGYADDCYLKQEEAAVV